MLDDCFSLPAEYSRHSRTLIAWPYRADVWRLCAEPAREAFASVIQAISRFEPVTVICHPEHCQSADFLSCDDVDIVQLPYDDAWMRDIGPWIGSDAQGTAALAWEFNSWGGLLDSCQQDKALAEEYCKLTGIRPIHPGIVMEGGSITIDGEGTLITTEQCLLNPNRNPHLKKSEIEEYLRRYTGSRKIIWLAEGLAGDEDTDGHVDNLCAFLAPGKVALAWTDDPCHPQYGRTHSAYQKLTEETDVSGRQIEIIKLHCPPAEYVTEIEAKGLAEGSGFRRAGALLPSSYANLYQCNGAIMVPGLADPEYDQKAVEALVKACPEREIIQVQTREILLGGGNIHCITMQVPDLP